MTTAEVAKQLVELCRKGEFLQAIDKFYAANIVSQEGCEMPNIPRTTRGLAGVKKKSEWWVENHTVHSAKVGDPYVSLEKFAVEFDMDVTEKQTGKRLTMRELGVYTVEGGKIVHEEFLYAGQ